MTEKKSRFPDVTAEHLARGETGIGFTLDGDPGVPPSKEPVFFVRPPEGATKAEAVAALADAMADGIIARANVWRAKHGLPPMPKE